MKLQQKVQALIDERLFTAFWDAAAHFNNLDLVLVFDTSESNDPVSAFVREKLIAGGDAPDELRSMINKPAKEAAKILKGSTTAFWFVVYFPEGEMACTAVIAERMAESGVAWYCHPS